MTEKLDYVREKIMAFLNGHGIGESTTSRIDLSVYEAVVNIIEHGSPEFNDRDIQIDCDVRDDEIAVRISYYGNEFDLTRATLPDIEQHYKSGKMRGLGIYFIMTLMDRVEYTHTDMVNTLMMVKKR